jgi:microcystin degradation protein MlrC
MRIAFGGIATESCTFSPWPTRLEDFVVSRGDEMFTQDRYPFFDTFPATFLPTLYARALPGGPVAGETYQQLKNELLERLRQLGAVDGFYLDLHGAMNVSGMDDAEADLATAIREIVGPDCFITASMDLHGNISQRYIEQIDILTAYRTAPHIDTVETRHKACTMLVRCLQENRRPQRAWLPVPVILPGERTSTEVEPAASLYAQLAEVDRVPGVLDASIFVGYVWADEPRSGAAIVVTGFEREVIESVAIRLAQAYWEARRGFTFGVPAGGIDQCIEWALAAPEPSIFISDSGDNPTAGGVGDVPFCLERLLAWKVPSAVVASIPDPAAVRACQQAGLGGVVSVSVGGKLDPVHGRPLPVTGTVLHLAKADPVGGDIAVIQVDNVKVIVTERRKPFHYIADFEKLGLDPLAHKIVVVKIGYLVPDLKRAAPRALLALSPGAVDQAIERLPFKRVRRPIYPLDPDMAWQPV